MDYTAFIKRFRGRVLLGLPPAPLSYLWKSNRTEGRPHIFLDRCPLWLRLFPLATVHISAARRYSDTLLWELSDLAAQNTEKFLSLIPCVPEAYGFVEKHREILEASYIIQTEFGGTL